MSKDISVLLGNKINIKNGEGKNSIQQVGNTVNGNNTAAFGNRNTILGDCSFTAGCDNTSVRDHTILIGYKLQSWGEYQVLLGTSNGTTQPTYESSLSIFTQTKGEVFWVHKSTGNVSITTNLFVASLITGTGCGVRGENSIAAGSWSVTRLKNRFAFGSSLDTGSYDSVPSTTVIGFLNQPEDGDVFQVGIGTTSQGRKNGFRVLSDGRVKVASAPVDGDDVVRKDDLSSPNMFKTLFGNQNIVGTGNIDLFKHSIKGVLGNSTFYLRIYSSKNLQANSLTDLKTILGDTFEESVTGSNGIMAITNEKVLYEDGTDASIAGYTITDKVITI